MVSISPEKEQEFLNSLSLCKFEKLGVVTQGVISIDNADWGSISEWKNKYDTAIELYLKKQPENGIE